MTDVSIREATDADLPGIIALLAQLDPNDPNREDLASPLPGAYKRALRQLLEAGHRLLVVDDGARVVGTLALYVVPNVSPTAALRSPSLRTSSWTMRSDRKVTGGC